jgi:hypothetical protein
MPAPQVFNKKYSLVFASNSADLPANMRSIEAATKKLSSENIAFSLSIDSPQHYASFAKTLVESRQNNLTTWLNQLNAANIKYSSNLKILLQRSHEINISIEYKHHTNLLKEY